MDGIFFFFRRYLFFSPSFSSWFPLLMVTNTFRKPFDPPTVMSWNPQQLLLNMNGGSRYCGFIQPPVSPNVLQSNVTPNWANPSFFPPPLPNPITFSPMALVASPLFFAIVGLLAGDYRLPCGLRHSEHNRQLKLSPQAKP